MCVSVCVCVCVCVSECVCVRVWRERVQDVQCREDFIKVSGCVHVRYGVRVVSIYTHL